MKNLIIIIVIIPLLLSAFLLSAQKVNVTEGPRAEFSKYKTFRVEDGDLVLVMPSPPPVESLKSVVLKAIEEEMQARGWQLSNDSSAHLSVSFVAEVLERVEQANLGPLGETPAQTGADLNQSRTWTQAVRTGSLVLEIREPDSQENLWRSSAEINFRSAELSEVLRAAVIRSVRKFPKSKK